MWWHCEYRAHPRVRVSDLSRRFLRQHDAGTNQPSQIRGWFSYPSGVDGFVLIEAETPREVAAIIEPYARLVTWQVQAISELNYNQTLEELRRSTQARAVDELSSGLLPASAAAPPSRNGAEPFEPAEP
jgi:hypothetical protein